MIRSFGHFYPNLRAEALRVGLIQILPPCGRRWQEHVTLLLKWRHIYAKRRDAVRYLAPGEREEVTSLLERFNDEGRRFLFSLRLQLWWILNLLCSFINRGRFSSSESPDRLQAVRGFIKSNMYEHWLTDAAWSHGGLRRQQRLTVWSYLHTGTRLFITHWAQISYRHEKLTLDSDFSCMTWPGATTCHKEQGFFELTTSRTLIRNRTLSRFSDGTTNQEDLGFGDVVGE